MFAAIAKTLSLAAGAKVAMNCLKACGVGAACLMDLSNASLSVGADQVATVAAQAGMVVRQVSGTATSGGGGGGGGGIQAMQNANANSNAISAGVASRIAALQAANN